MVGHMEAEPPVKWKVGTSGSLHSSGPHPALHRMAAAPRRLEIRQPPAAAIGELMR